MGQQSWDPKVIMAWVKRYQDTMQAASEARIPLPFQESCVRDTLAAIDAMRLGPGLRQQLGVEEITKQ